MDYKIVCKLIQCQNPINYIFSESLLNINSIFGFCFDDIDHTKQLQQILYDNDVGQL